MAGRRRHRWITGVLVLGAILSSCGDGDDASSAGVDSTTTSAPPSSAPTTTVAIASWPDPDSIIENAPEQVLPTLAELIAVIDEENLALGATDDLSYPEADQALRVSIQEGPCTQVTFASFFYDADVGLTEAPAVGILAPSVTAYVCEDDAAIADQATFALDLVDLDQGPCPVDDVGDDALGVRVCPRQPGERLRAWKGTAIGVVDRVLIWATTDFGPDTDPVAGAASLDTLLAGVLDHVDDRLG